MKTLTKFSKKSYDEALFSAYGSEGACGFAFALGVASLVVGAAAIVVTGPAGVALIYGFGTSFGIHSIVLGGSCLGYW